MTTHQNLLKFADATGHEIFCKDYGWLETAVETQETIADFEVASITYNECSNQKYGQIAGFNFISFAQIQVRKGDQRRALSVIDLGGERFAIDCDLSEI